LTPEQDPDVQLMLAVQRGDDRAFRTLFEKYAAPITSYAMQMVGSRARAEEITQDVFLQVYRHRAEYAPRARFVTWLYRMTSNACISEARRVEHRDTAYSMDQPMDGSGDPPPQLADPEGITGEESLARREVLDRLQAALAALPPQQRAAVLLARVEGMSYEEIASTLSCSVSAVKSLVHRATVNLRQQMGDEGM
jgi:RNA polymerase sigma-70 factor (ECF subfamily)